MVQLWVNLPAKDKMTPPAYQAILNQTIPSVPLADQAGTIRVIAGEYNGNAGPAKTYTPMHVWDMQLRQGAIGEFRLTEGWNAALVVLHGSILINGYALAREAQLIVLEPDQSALTIEAKTDAKVLLLSGEPIAEPIVGHGPFVMNSQHEIDQAIIDYNEGRFGQMQMRCSLGMKLSEIEKKPMYKNTDLKPVFF